MTTCCGAAAQTGNDLPKAATPTRNAAPRHRLRLGRPRSICGSPLRLPCRWDHHLTRTAALCGAILPWSGRGNPPARLPRDSRPIRSRGERWNDRARRLPKLSRLYARRLPFVRRGRSLCLPGDRGQSSGLRARSMDAALHFSQPVLLSLSGRLPARPKVCSLSREWKTMGRITIAPFCLGRRTCGVPGHVSRSVLMSVSSGCGVSI